MIQRANLAYGDFIKSQEGVTFNGQVSRAVGEGKTEALQGGPAWTSSPAGAGSDGSPQPAPCKQGHHSDPRPVPLQVCLIGDCVGGILAFDALCYSHQPVSESQSSSRRGSVASVQVPASPGPQSRTPSRMGTVSPFGSKHPPASVKVMEEQRLPVQVPRGMRWVRGAVSSYSW